jgi:hypothetical protein
MFATAAPLNDTTGVVECLRLISTHWADVVTLGRISSRSGGFRHARADFVTLGRISSRSGGFRRARSDFVALDLARPSKVTKALMGTGFVTLAGVT